MKKSFYIFLLLCCLSGCNYMSQKNKSNIQNKTDFGVFAEPLSNEEEIRIKKEFIKYSDYKDTVVDDIKIECYYGKYNGYTVVLLKNMNYGDTGVETDIVVADFVFHYKYSNREIMLFTGDYFYTLLEAYDNKKILIDDLESISNLHKSFNGETD